MMRSALVEDGVVVNVIVGSLPGYVKCPVEVGPGWAFAGDMFVPPASADPEPVTLAQYQAAVEMHVEATARARSYSSAVSCASYVGSTNSGWAAEAQAFVAWRDDVWEAAFSALAAWQAGGDPPSIEDLVASLPEMGWPPAA